MAGFKRGEGEAIWCIISLKLKSWYSIVCSYLVDDLENRFYLPSLFHCQMCCKKLLTTATSLCLMWPKQTDFSIDNLYLQINSFTPSLKAANALVCFSPQEGNSHLTFIYIPSHKDRYLQWKACTDLSRCSSKQKQTAVNKINSILFWIHNLGCLYQVFDLTPDDKGKRPSTNLLIIDTSHRTRTFMAKINVFLLSHNLVPVVHTGRIGLPASAPAWSARKQRIQMDNCYSLVLYLTGPLSVSGETNWFDSTGGRSNWLGYVSQRWVGGGLWCHLGVSKPLDNPGVSSSLRAFPILSQGQLLPACHPSQLKRCRDIHSAKPGLTDPDSCHHQ